MTPTPEQMRQWADVLNTAAGMTLIVILQCDTCGEWFPTNPRVRLARCFSCRRRHRIHRKQRDFVGFT